MWKRVTLCLIVVTAFLTGTNVFAKPITINVLSQPRREWEYLQQFLGEFKAKEGIDVKISYFAELERRSKSRLDASTKAGQFQVYYIDEANIAEFASNNWLLPIKDYYPAENDFSDFSPPLVKVLTWKGVPYGAPISFEGSLIFYRKDLFQKDGIAVPKTLDQYLDAVKHFQHPPDLYGTGTRGLRGSGMNVWRFSPYLIRFGGKWLDDNGNPVFNSPEAVKAVQYYIELIKNSPGPTMSWSDVMDNFAAGKEAIVEFANLKMDYLMDPKQSKVIDKMGFAAPANGLSNIAVHGLAISASGCPTDDVRKAAGKFIGWWTSKENSIRRVKSGNGLTNGRISTFASREFAAAYPADFVQAQKDMMKMQQMCILQIPQWPEIGDYLGVKLEELFTKAYSGESYDIQAALDDAVNYAKGVLQR
jgi:multiple sugar transport system substrate-binding protein